nr:uncharacterized protein LOC129382092 [Dermacentor andersoni]
MTHSSASQLAEKLRALVSGVLKLSLKWLSSHVGVEGSEEADDLVKAVHHATVPLSTTLRVFNYARHTLQPSLMVLHLDRFRDGFHTGKGHRRKNPLEPWQRRELVVRSPSLVRGYWGRLHEPITDEKGWYSTDDLCYYDKDSWLYLVARLNDYFCIRGCKYWPAEVDAMLLKCPGVHYCAVVGIPHLEAGEVAHAMVVPAPQARTLRAEHVTQFVEG